MAIASLIPIRKDITYCPRIIAYKFNIFLIVKHKNGRNFLEASDSIKDDNLLIFYNHCRSLVDKIHVQHKPNMSNTASSLKLNNKITPQLCLISRFWQLITQQIVFIQLENLTHNSLVHYMKEWNNSLKWNSKELSVQCQKMIHTWLWPQCISLM